jgi:hypothetical protein
MYPVFASYLRSGFGSFVQTSLSRAFLHDGPIGLSLIARSTFPRKLPKLSALSSQLSVKSF